VRYHLGPARLTEADVAGASVDSSSQPPNHLIFVKFSASGQKKFTALTAEIIGQPLAIELDGAVITAPVIQARIDGDAQISGTFNRAEAETLAALLNG